MQIFITRNDNQLKWIAIDIDENGKVIAIEQADYIENAAMPINWQAIPMQNWPIATPMFDVDDGNQVQLIIDENQQVHKIVLRKLGSALTPLRAAKWQDNNWVKDDVFFKQYQKSKPELRECVLNDGEKYAIKKQVQAYSDAQPKAWEVARKEDLSFDDVDTNTRLTRLQQFTANQIIVWACQSLKEGSSSKAEYANALSAVIQGILDDSVRAQLSDETYTNALDLRARCSASYINEIIKPGPFYADNNSVSKSVTIADIRAYLFTVLSREWKKHAEENVTLKIPARVSAEEVAIGCADLTGGLARFYLGLNPRNSEAFRLIYRAMENGLQNLTVAEIDIVDEFIGTRDDLTADQREVMDDLAAAQGGAEYVRNATRLRDDLAKTRVVKHARESIAKQDIVRIRELIADSTLLRKVIGYLSDQEKIVLLNAVRDVDQ